MAGEENGCQLAQFSWVLLHLLALAAAGCGRGRGTECCVCRLFVGEVNGVQVKCEGGFSTDFV